MIALKNHDALFKLDRKVARAPGPNGPAWPVTDTIYLVRNHLSKTIWSRTSHQGSESM